MQLLRDAYDIFGAAPVHFGALLRMLRDRHGISQAAVVAHLPETISQRRYSSFELDGRSPRFDELTTLYRALYQAGVHYTIQDRRLFLALAQQKFANKKTHKAPASEEEWERLRLELAQLDHLPDEASLRRQAVVTQNAPLPRRETGHLLGREGWLNLLFGAVQQPSVTKVIIVQGPPGSGKTSELHRIANHYLQSIPRYHIVLCQPPSIELDGLGPEIALEMLLGDILEVVGSPYASLPTTSLQARVKYVLECLARADRPVLVLLDNAEHTLDEQGDLVPVWRQFLQKFVHTRHYACLVLTTQEWPGAFLEEPQLIMHTMIPPLS